MSLYIVTVEAVAPDGDMSWYEVVTLAHTEKSARVLATRAVTRIGETRSCHSVGIRMANPYTTGAVLIRKKEATDAIA